MTEFVIFLLLSHRHTQTDYKDRTAFFKRDKRRKNGMKCNKKRSFQVGSKSSLSSCKDVMASNVSQLSLVERLIKYALRP